MLPCGCLVGVYETYDGAVIEVVDARSPACQDAGHARGATVPAGPAGRVETHTR